jgi:hypothetical protein
MKKYFVSSFFDSPEMVSRNAYQAQKIFPDVQMIQGQGSVIETYRKLSELDENQLFMWIDADNFVYPAARQLLGYDEPVIANAENEFGITYGHGGIKLCPGRKDIRSQVIDVSYYLGLKPIDILASRHTLGNEWLRDRAIIVEIIKLLLCGKHSSSDQWRVKTPKHFNLAERVLKSCDCLEIRELILNRKSFKEFYEKHSLSSNL